MCEPPWRIPLLFKTPLVDGQAWSLHLAERYNMGRCEMISDLSPCRWPPGGRSRGAGQPRTWLDFQLAWPRNAAGLAPSGGAGLPQFVIQMSIK